MFVEKVGSKKSLGALGFKAAASQDIYDPGAGALYERSLRTLEALHQFNKKGMNGDVESAELGHIFVEVLTHF